jgi:O-methyltransferase domain
MTMARRNESQKWFDYFPVGEKLAVSAPEEVALVDVGGGIGHDVIALKIAHPELKGRLVLEDLPQVIQSVKVLPSGIESIPHDMFKPQPVKGARGYFLRNVLHDWPDKQCAIVLSNLCEAMAPESMLLISEALMPETNVPFYNCAADLNMMAAFSAMDRTEAQFRKLIEGCGFEIVKVWKPTEEKAGAAVVFEARKKD